MRQPAESDTVRPLVDWTAKQIDDPVWRLRYLRAVAPPPGRARKFRWKSWKTIAILTAVALGGLVAPLSLRMPAAPTAASSTLPALPAPPPIASPVPVAVTPVVDVWPVEKNPRYDVYSNGLRVENQYAVSHRPRAYVAYPYKYLEGAAGERRSEPVGIVYHTTESMQAPFEFSQNNVLKRVGESLLDYVRRRRCYNFVIDRFGRVFRVVNESDAADHAGHSVWADDRYFYVNLNDSFIGISFEAQTGAGESLTSAGNAQVRAAAMLTEMLRSRYKIAGRNCVTHAQVSVNPSNMQIGYHVDWASSFPFEKLGLPDNYATPSPAVALFGFGFDGAYQQRAGVRLAAGAVDAERSIAERAKSAGVSATAYRKELHRRFQKVAASLRS